MDSNEINKTLRQRSTEVDKIISRLKSKIVSSTSKDNDLLNIVTDQREKLLVSELENKDLKRKIDDLNTQLKAEDKLFYLLNDLKKENQALKSELEECSEMQSKVAKKNFLNLMEEMERVKNEAEGRIHSLEDTNYRLENEIFELKKNNASGDERKYTADLEHELKNIVTEYEKYKIEMNDYSNRLAEENGRLKKEMIIIENEFSNIKQENEIHNQEILQMRLMEEKLLTQTEELNITIDWQKKTISQYKNEIIDLKGNIRVFCRVRPVLLDSEKYNFLIGPNSVNIDGSNFTFDRIFDPSNSQPEIFDEVHFLIESIFEGYDSCIFAYGQTGSGKTYTMEGPEYDMGIIPRSVEQIFNLCDHFTLKGWEIKLIVSYIEIYNESINDLLSDPVSNAKYEIKHENDCTYIKNCRYVEIKSKDEALALLKIASKNRSVGSTKCNDRSSRSHSVFTFTIAMNNSSENETRKGTLNLIDLAGSERLHDSGSEGIRLKETQNINKSLSALGNVINALIRNESYIPFRNSKLTYFMQNYLSGRARVLMFVNVSPELRHLNETLCSLRFASSVSECKLGQANKNICRKV